MGVEWAQEPDHPDEHIAAVSDTLSLFASQSRDPEGFVWSVEAHHNRFELKTWTAVAGGHAVSFGEAQRSAETAARDWVRRQAEALGMTCGNEVDARLSSFDRYLELLRQRYDDLHARSIERGEIHGSMIHAANVSTVIAIQSQARTLGLLPPLPEVKG